MKRLICLLLVLSLIFSITGCIPVHEDPSNSKEMQFYREAMAALAAKKDISITATIDETLVLGSDTYKKSSTQKITYLALGTDGMKATVEETLRYDDYTSDISEIYCDGIAYATIYSSDFSSPMTGEEFAARYLPVVILDESLYGSFNVEQDGEDYIYTFTNASTLEAWLDAPGRSVTEATATAYVTSEGEVTSLKYSAAYTNLGSQTTFDVTLEFETPQTTDIAAPANKESYTSLEYLDGPRMLEDVFGYLGQAQTISFTEKEQIVSQAGGLVALINISIDSWGSGANLLSELTYSHNLTDYNSQQTFTMEQTERFEDGKYTISVDGGEPTGNRSITASQVTDYIMQTITAEVYDCATFTQAVCTDLGNLLLVEFTGNDTLAERFEESICQFAFGDPEILDKNATSSRVETVDYYVGIDKYLGIPSSIGVHYTAYHTIGGVEYLLDLQFDQSIYLGSRTAYEAVTKHSAPDVKPDKFATPAFYHVTGPDGEELWLLGTIHVGDERTGYLPQAIYDALNASDALAVECNTRTFEDQVKADEKLQQAITECYYYTDGSATKDHIDDEEMYELAMKLMKASGNYFYNAPYMTAATWANTISNSPMKQCYSFSSDKGVDNRLQMLAEDSGKKILEVESNLFQLQMLTGWSQELTMLLLEDALATDAAAYYDELVETYEIWCAGDEAALREYLKTDTSGKTDEERKLYEEYNNAMGPDRDKEMIKTAISYLESGETVFFAVGLAHVLAENGLVDGLRAAGYTVELVTYE